jgi:DNA replication protein DnaC
MTDVPAGPCQSCGKDTPDDRVPLPFGDRTALAPLYCPPCAVSLERSADERQAALDEEHRQATFSERIRRSGLPRAYYEADCTLDTLDTAGRVDALDAARRFGAGELLGLLLIGPIGVGKSSIAAAAAKRYMLNVGSLRWLPVHQITVHLGLPFDDPVRADTIKALSASKALALDDLDKTRPTAYAAEPLFSAIDRAVSERQPLVVTSNLDLAQLATHWPDPFGVALASRLAGYCETWKIQGTDRRRGLPA